MRGKGEPEIRDLGRPAGRGDAARLSAVANLAGRTWPVEDEVRWRERLVAVLKEIGRNEGER
jgi:hypothetical protein